MPTDVEKRLELLPKMSKEKLLTVWTDIFKEAPRAKLRRNLLIKILAYKIQEREYGGLSMATRHKLREIAQSIDGNHGQSLSADGSTAQPGTRLLREWRGKSHHVIVLEGGYEYAGKRYSSLSRIAREITGTSWSGPLFFGLKSPKSKEQPNGR